MMSAKFSDILTHPHLDLFHTIKFTQPSSYVRFSMTPSDADVISGSSPIRGFASSQSVIRGLTFLR